MKKLDAADTTSKTNALHMAVGGPWMSVAEARAEDGLPKEVIGTIYPPPNMNAAPGGAGKGRWGERGKGSGKRGDRGSRRQAHRGDDPGGRDGAHDAEPQAAAERVPRDVRPGEEPLESRDPQFRRRPLGHARQRHPRALQRRRQDRRRDRRALPTHPRSPKKRDPWDTEPKPPRPRKSASTPRPGPERRSTRRPPSTVWSRSTWPRRCSMPTKWPRRSTAIARRQRSMPASSRA